MYITIHEAFRSYDNACIFVVFILNFAPLHILRPLALLGELSIVWTGVTVFHKTWTMKAYQKSRLSMITAKETIMVHICIWVKVNRFDLNQLGAHTNSNIHKMTLDGMYAYILMFLFSGLTFISTM